MDHKLRGQDVDRLEVRNAIQTHMYRERETDHSGLTLANVFQLKKKKQSVVEKFRRREEINNPPSQARERARVSPPPLEICTKKSLRKVKIQF